MKILQSATTKLGNKIELIGKEQNENNVLIIGVFHGDEPQGKYLIEKYLKLYSPSSKSKISVIPSREDINILKLSQNLRKTMTKQEVILWQYIRNKQIEDAKFRRQVPINKYICDFVCFEKKIIIEIDGGQHNFDKQHEKDLARDDFFTSQGFKILRFWNNDIENNIEGVIQKIIDTIKQCPPLVGGSEFSIPRRGLLFITCLNPDGFKLGTRTNANGVDLNRNFPTKNWGEDTSGAGENPKDYYAGENAASEIETQFVIDIIEKYQPKMILTLHAPYKIVNYDGPAQGIAQKISDIIGYPVEESIGYPTPGSFGTYCGVERNIPTITLELDEKIPVAQLEQPVFEIFDMIIHNI